MLCRNSATVCEIYLGSSDVAHPAFLLIVLISHNFMNILSITVEIHTSIAELEEQKRLLGDRLGFTSEFKEISENKEGIVDIQEEYDPEKERLWKGKISGMSGGEGALL